MAQRPLVILTALLLSGAVAGVCLWKGGTSKYETPVHGPDTRALKPVAIGFHVSNEPAVPSASPSTKSEGTEALSAQVNAMRQQDRGSATPCTKPQPLDISDTSADFDGIGIGLVRVRQLPDLPATTLPENRQAIERRMAKWLTTQYPPDYGPRLGRALAAIGAIPEPVDVIALKAAFLSYQIGAWYDSQEGKLYLAEPEKEEDGKENALGLAYGYLFRSYASSLFPQERGGFTTDSRLARESLIAGDAALTRLLHSLKDPQHGGGGGVTEDPDDPSHAVPMPHFLRELELAPFSRGLDFIQALHSLGGLDQVNAAYERPPLSCAEVVDAQEYLAETPVARPALDAKDLNVAGATPVFDDTLGVYCLGLYLKEYMTPPVAAAAVAHWTNDRLLVYPPASGKGRDQAVWQIRCKDATAADAFFQTMRQQLSSRYKSGSTSTTEPGGGLKIESGGRVVSLQRDGETGVLLVDAADGGFASVAVEKFTTK